MRSALRFASRRQLRPSAAFTLTELLVAALVSSLTVVVAVQILGPQLRGNQKMEGYMRLQERWARVAYLLDTEVQKARGCRPGITAGAAGQCGITVGTNSLTFYAPISTGTAGAAVGAITYRQVGTQLLRDGPTINDWGQLNPATSLSGELVLDGVAAGSFLPAVSSTTVNYTIDLTDPNSDASYKGRGSTARGRANCLSLEADADPSCSN